MNVAARSKAWVCGRSPAEIVGSNPTGGMNVCLLWVFCVVRYRSLWRADLSSREVIRSVMRRCVWSRNLFNEEAMAHWGFFFLRNSPQWAKAYSFTRFLDLTQRRITVGRTPLDEWSARRRDLYLTTHNTHNKHPCPRWDWNPRSQQAGGRRPTP